MAILLPVARMPRTDRATLPGSRWIRMNVKIMTPVTTRTACPDRRMRYQVTRPSLRVVPGLGVQPAGEGIQRGEALQVALVHLDDLRQRQPEPGKLPGHVVLVLEERLGAGTVQGGGDQPVRGRVGVAARV